MTANLANHPNLQDHGSLARLLHAHGIPLASPWDLQAFGTAFDRFGSANLVLLGESTHGTSEFYAARAAITRRLIEHHGFTVVAVEADWPDAARIDGYVRHHRSRPHAGEPFVRFPAWMWRNREVLAFADWLRNHNEGRSPLEETGFYGLDVYSLASSIDAVLGYLDHVDAAEAKRARWRYGCLTPWQDNPTHYGLAVRAGMERCEPQAVAQLQALLDRRLDYVRKDGEQWFDAYQNARIVRAAEGYYQAMVRNSKESWNLRDRHMFGTLQAVLASRGPGTKAVVWAHNSHIGNAAATAMGWYGETNIGELARTAYGDGAVCIGFGTDHGTVAAASDWGAEMEVKTVRPSRPDSLEHAFHHSGHARSLTFWNDWRDQDLREALAMPILQRAIGVIYRPETELQSHYFQSVPRDQYDAFVWFDESHAVTPLGHEQPHGAPETYPFGL
jgi:erythromycin esterase-like protein